MNRCPKCGKAFDTHEALLRHLSDIFECRIAALEQTAAGGLGKEWIEIFTAALRPGRTA
jgi:hypothetical protein